MGPEKRARAPESWYFAPGLRFISKWGGVGEVNHRPDCELRKERRGACVSVPLIPRGPEDLACGGASGARLFIPRIRFQTLGSLLCH